jgi:hypothetical protein
MRSIGGGVGSGQTIPAGRLTELSGVGVATGVGVETTTTGLRLVVGVVLLPPQEKSARPMAAQAKARNGLIGVS